MKYTTIQRANPQDRSKVKWYARPIIERRVRMKEITDEVTLLTELRFRMVRKVLLTLFDVIVRHLLAGRSVTLRPFGVVRLSFTSDGYETPEHITPERIRELKVIIIPDVALKERLRNLQFELEQETICE